MSAIAPWLSCCSSCSDRARHAGALPTAAPAAPAEPAPFSTGTGALLLIGGIFLAVVYGEKWLTKRGG